MSNESTISLRKRQAWMLAASLLALGEMPRGVGHRTGGGSPGKLRSQNKRRLIARRANVFTRRK